MIALEGLSGHFAFVGVYGLAAGMAAVTVGACIAGGPRGSVLVRVGSVVTAVMAFVATVIAVRTLPNVPYSPYGPSADVVAMAVIGALALTTIAAAISIEEARGAALWAVVTALAVSGLTMYLLLYANAFDKRAAFGWELRRLSVFCSAMGALAVVGALLVPAFSVRRSATARVASTVAALCGLGATVLALGLSGGAALKPFAVLALFFLPFVACCGWFWFRSRNAAIVVSEPAPGQGGLATVGTRIRSWLNGARTIPHNRAATLLIAALPVVLGMLALALSRGGSAREAARITLGGLTFTPALLVPFAFAPALGLLLGGRAFRRGHALGAIALTLVTVTLLIGQKEIGYTAVCLGVATATFLVVRGNMLQIAAGGAAGVAAVSLAFELQPLIPAIPFTVRERLMMWLGGASMARRGGHLLIADRVTYDVGGFHGVGIHTELGFEPVRVVNSLDTDFPLAALGLFGGFPWLIAYIVLFVAFAIVLYDLARRQARVGSSYDRYRLPVLVALGTVLVASTVVNISGGLTHLVPFAGVPAIFLSYGTFFIGGTCAVVLVFFMASQRAALTSELRDTARDELGLARLPEHRPTAADWPAVSVRPEPWWRNMSWPGFKLWFRRRTVRLRLVGVNGGATLVIVGLLGLATLWGQSLHERFTDQPKAHTHPALAGETVRLRPLAPGIWDVPADPDEPKPPEGWAGVMEEDRRYRLGPLEFSFRDGYLSLRGGCWSFEKATAEGITIGFEGWLDVDLGALGRLGKATARELGSGRKRSNDLVLPLGPVALRHLTITRRGEGTYSVASTGPGRFVVYDGAGAQLTPPRRGSTEVKAGYRIALADDGRLHFALDERANPEDPYSGELCVVNPKRAVMRWRLSRWRDTLIGGPELLRRTPVEQSVDFEFAEDIKRAAESSLLGLSDGRLWVTPWDRATRSRWDPLTRKRFFRVFRIRRQRLRGGQQKEVLHWVRQFYRDGSSKVRFDAPARAFGTAWKGSSSTIIGLQDAFRFRRRLPTRARQLVREEGRLMARGGEVIARFDKATQRWRSTLKGLGRLIGYGFARTGTYGGLIRVFRTLLHGRPVRTRTPDEALSEKMIDRQADLIGVDIELTLDASLQRKLRDIVEEEVRNLIELAIAAGDANWRPRARLLVLGRDNAILGAASYPALEPYTLRSVQRAQAKAVKEPLNAAGVDAWRRTTTVGSTAKIGVLVAAARDAGSHFRPFGRDDLCINAQGDPVYADRRGCFIEKGRLGSFRGTPIAALFNSAGSYIGGISTVRRLVARSENTSAAYLAGRLGLNGLRDYYKTLGAAGRGNDLLPDLLSRNPRFGPDIERFRGDPLGALPVRLGEVPKGDTWKLDYTVRLALSGFSDLSLLHVGMSAAIAARDGRHYPPFLVGAMRDLQDGERIAVNPPPPLQVIPVRIARHIKRAMVETVRDGTAVGIKRYLRPASPGLYREVGVKTGTAETVRADPSAKPDPTRRKPKTQDHKFAVGFWPASSREPYVFVAAFEYASHLDKRVALRMLARAVIALRAQDIP